MAEESTDKIVFALVGGLGDRTPQTGEAGGPQLSMHTSADRDIAPEALNGVLDRLVDAYKRQHARMEIERIRAAIRGGEQMIKDAYANDKARVERYNRQKASLGEQIKHCEDQVPAVLAQAEAAWRESGRSGAFKPDDRATSPYGALKKRAKELHQEIAKLDLEQTEPMNQLKAIVESHEAGIKQAEEAIARLEIIVTPPVNEAKSRKASG